MDSITPSWPTPVTCGKSSLFPVTHGFAQYLPCVGSGGKQGEGGSQKTVGGSALFLSLQEDVPWHLSALCQTYKGPGCPRETCQTPAAKDHGAAVALLGTGSTLSPYAGTFSRLWPCGSLACTSLEDSLPVLTCPALWTGSSWAGCYHVSAPLDWKESKQHGIRSPCKLFKHIWCSWEFEVKAKRGKTNSFNEIFWID